MINKKDYIIGVGMLLYFIHVIALLKEVIPKTSYIIYLWVMTMLFIIINGVLIYK